MTLYANFSPQTVDVKMNSQSVSADMRDAERIPTPGRQGDPGFSPIVSVEDIEGGHRVTITDEDGDHAFNVMDGADGKDGEDGKDGKDGKDGQTGRTPEIFATATTLPAGSDATANISGTIEQPLLTVGVPRGADGQNGQDGQNGRDGQDGQDGVSPTVSVTEITGGHSVSVTDKNGTQTFSVMDGAQGEPGTTDYNDLENKPTIPSTAADVGALPDTTLYAGAAVAGGTAGKAEGIPFGEVDGTSTSTAFTATVPGISELKDGTVMLLRNGVVTSASGFTIDINNLGAKPVYNNMATGNPVTPTAPSKETTLFNINYTLLFVYSTTLVEGGCWLLYRGYNSDTNTIAYQIRTNSTVMKTADQSRYYRLFFTSADGTHMVPANTAKDNSATSKKTVNTRPIDPFGRIIYYSYTTNLSAESDLGATYCWEQYTFSLGYSFNTTGSALTMTTKTPVYIKATPQTDGSAIIDSTTPFVQSLPTANDGKIYIFLGIAYSATNVEMQLKHPVYYHNGTGIRIWTGGA